MQVTSFAPQTAADTHIVLLGSMPGVKSLQAQQYYAHPRNAFWPIICQLLTLASDADYVQRLAALNHAGISLWDVLSDCRRPGSLDSAIDRQTEVPNNMAAWFEQMPNLRVVGLNGGAAWQKYQRYMVKPGLHPAHVELVKLPSTSPAYAAMPEQRKAQLWHAALAPHLF